MNSTDIFNEVLTSLIDQHRKTYGNDPNEDELEKMEKWTNTITGGRRHGMAGLDSLLKGLPEKNE